MALTLAEGLVMSKFIEVSIVIVIILIACLAVDGYIGCSRSNGDYVRGPFLMECINFDKGV